MRILVALSTAALIAGCAASFWEAGKRDVLFVANLGDGTITLIDGKIVCDAAKLYDFFALERASLETLATIPVPGGRSIEAETSDDGHDCFVANRKTTASPVISYETRKEVRRIPAGVGPQEMSEVSVPDALVRAGGS